MSARLAAVILLGLAAGCYNYFPLTTADPRPGTRAAAQLSDSGTLALGRYLGPDVADEEGRLVAVTDQDIVISVVTVRNRNGVEHYWIGELVTLPRSNVTIRRHRKLA